jgi:predicted kinase
MIVEVLVGPIASGKSTYAKQKAKEGWIIINDDAIVNAVHADNYTLYREELKPLYKSVENHILHCAVLMGKDVIIDRGLSNTIKSRQRWIALARSMDVKIGAVLFEVFGPETHAKRRVETDGRGHNFEYWLKVAERHWANWQPPTLAEGFDYIEEQKWED